MTAQHRKLLLKIQTLLNTVLSTNFNILYDATLNEEEKSELKKILAITDDELEKNFKVLKEEVTTKMNDMLTKEKNDDLRLKLDTARDRSNAHGSK